MKHIIGVILVLFIVFFTDVQLFAQAPESSHQTDSIPKLSVNDRLSAIRSREYILSPLLSYNVYDGMQLGGVYTNYLGSRPGFKYTVAPMYAFSSNRVVGSAGLSYALVKQVAWYDRLRLGLELRHYSYDENVSYDTQDQYYKVAPELAFYKDVDKDEFTVRHRLSYRIINIWTRFTRGISIEEGLFERMNNYYYVNELRYEQHNMHDFNPSETVLLMHQGNNFIKLFAYRQQSFEYQEDRSIRVHINGTYIPSDNTTFDDAAVRPSLNGVRGTEGSGLLQYEYTFDQNFIGRSRQSGLWSRQAYKKGAGLNTYLTNIDFVDNWVVGLGGEMDFPFLIKIQAYFDMAIYRSLRNDKVTTNYSSGIAIPIFNDHIRIFLPIIESADIRNLHSDLDHNYWERISFTIRLKNLDRLVDKYYN